jgi:tRNA/rRNA methyltransferase
MNLGQAVAVCCYELTRCMKAQRGTLLNIAEAQPDAPATLDEISRLNAAMDRLLLDQTSQEGKSPARARSAQLRQMFLRCRLRSRDVSLLLGVLRDLTWKMNRPG